jgi:hypothetical protein
MGLLRSLSLPPQVQDLGQEGGEHPIDLPTAMVYTYHNPFHFFRYFLEVCFCNVFYQKKWLLLRICESMFSSGQQNDLKLHGFLTVIRAYLFENNVHHNSLAL